MLSKSMPKTTGLNCMTLQCCGLPLTLEGFGFKVLGLGFRTQNPRNFRNGMESSLRDELLYDLSALPRCESGVCV